MNTAFYHNNNVSRWHLDQCEIPGQRYDNIDDFIISKHDRKFSVMDIPSFQDTTDFENQVNRLVSHCDRIILLSSEIHRDTVDLIQRLDHGKIINFICGELNFDQSYNRWLDWFVTSTRFYKSSQILDQLTPFSVKPKIFDILLGQPKPHRDIIFNFAKDHDDRIVMTYFKDHLTPLSQYDEKHWIWENDGLEVPDQDFNFTVTAVRYHGHNMSLSQIVPIKIYNQTAYSIVCETNFDNHYSFYTEKIVKPILARRLFIVFSGQYYLRNLRSLGFLTFDGIIDESYDLEPDLVRRGRLITEQMQYLFDQDQTKILEQITPIVEHNRNLMINTDWYREFSRELRVSLLDQQEQN